jgi:hypothetical protein
LKGFRIIRHWLYGAEIMKLMKRLSMGISETIQIFKRRFVAGLERLQENFHEVIPNAIKKYATMISKSIGKAHHPSDGDIKKALRKAILIIGAFGGENSRLKYTMKKFRVLLRNMVFRECRHWKLQNPCFQES